MFINKLNCMITSAYKVIIMEGTLNQRLSRLELLDHIVIVDFPILNRL